MTKEIKQFVKENYPDSAFYAIVRFNSEYNDCTYDNSVQSLMVFDRNKEELLPKKACTEKIMEILSNVECSETNEEKDDLAIIL